MIFLFTLFMISFLALSLIGWAFVRAGAMADKKMADLYNKEISRQKKSKDDKNLKSKEKYGQATTE